MLRILSAQQRPNVYRIAIVVCGTPKRKLQNGDQRLAPETQRSTTETLELADQRLGRTSLTRISHTNRRIGTANQRKLLCPNDFTWIQGQPRCRQSVAQNGLILEPWKAALWKRRSMLDW
jgi:hypothetical protein